jgi:hypothetical protein
VRFDAQAETFVMTPDDDWTILESARAGDIVEIAPGTYQFRVHLSNAGTADSPIVIRAQDPDDRPVWDLVGEGEDTFVDAWPGSYGAGDNHRGCWQVADSGAYYEISGIVFQNCRAPSSAGIRMINSGPVTLRDCLFQYNTNGLTGASSNLTVEYSEFYENGKTLTEGNATHHIYIFGGIFNLRYSYLHDGHEGQAFHIRARQSTIEYNWITRPANYVGDIMSCEQFCGDEPHQQTMLLRGNVVVQGEPSNGSQLFALFRDADADTDARMDLTLVHNTIIGTPRGGTHNLVNLRNDTVGAYLHASNNIIYQVGNIAEAAEPNADNWGIDGENNWVSDDTSAIDALGGTIVGTDPGFTALPEFDLTLTDTAEAAGKAAVIDGLPDRELAQSAEGVMAWRPRQSALDLGAFEFGTDSEAVGPYGEPPELPPDNSSEPDAGAGTTSSTDEGASDAGGATADGEASDGPEADASSAQDDPESSSSDATNDGTETADDASETDESIGPIDEHDAEDASSPSQTDESDDRPGSSSGADDSTPESAGDIDESGDSDAGAPASSTDSSKDGGCDCAVDDSRPSMSAWLWLTALLVTRRRRKA